MKIDPSLLLVFFLFFGYKNRQQTSNPDAKGRNPDPLMIIIIINTILLSSV